MRRMKDENHKPISSSRSRITTVSVSPQSRACALFVCDVLGVITKLFCYRFPVITKLVWLLFYLLSTDIVVLSVSNIQ